MSQPSSEHSNWQRVEETFLRLLDFPPESRREKLNELCGDDSLLAHEISSLLDAYDASDGFLEQSSLGIESLVDELLTEWQIPAQGLETKRGQSTSDLQIETDVKASNLDINLRLGDHTRQLPDLADLQRLISLVRADYRLDQLIGRGGSGLVVRGYDQRLQRTVAIKFLNPDLTKGKFANWLESEGRAAAGLTHDHIVPIYEVSPPESPLSFLVMKWIDGPTLRDWVNEHGPLEHRQAAELTRQLAEAVEHAHRCQTVHGDIKPINVLLQVREDSSTKPLWRSMLTDFGLARRIDRQSTPMAGFVGTPAYASPEQLLNMEPPSVASDVYSLGATLYELLCGAPPYRGSPQAVIQQMIDHDPVLLRSLERTIPADLESICFKALSRSPSQRYRTAGDFAADLQRFLDGHPVEARTVGPIRRFWMAVRRRPLVSGLMATIAVVMLVGIIANSIQARIARHQRDIAVEARQAESEQRQKAEQNEQEAIRMAELETEARQIAEQRTEETRTVLEFVEQHIIAAARPTNQEGGLGNQVTLREAIESAEHFFETGFSDLPIVEARLRMTLGTSFLYLGQLEKAKKHHELAHQIFTDQLGAEHATTLLAENYLTNCYFALGEYGRAREMYAATLAKRERVLGATHKQTLESRNNLANCYFHLGQIEQAVALNEKTLQLRRESLGPDHPDTLESEGNLALDYVELGRADEAFELMSRVSETLREQLGPEHPKVLMSQRNVAFINIRRGQLEEALKQYLELHELEKQHLDADHPDALQTIDHIGVIYGFLRRFDEALPWADLAFQKKRSKLGAQHAETLRAMMNLAGTYLQSEKFEEAFSIYQELRTLYADHPDLGPDPPTGVLYGAATAGLRVGNGSEAIKLIDECLDRAKSDPEYLRVAPDFINLRVQHFSGQGDLDECKNSAEIFESLGLSSIEHLLIAARLRVVVAGLSQFDDLSAEPPPDLDSRILTDTNADLAITHIRAAIERGLSNPQQLLQDPILKAIAQHPDLIALIGNDD
ncbi:MAG TPA: tetratricopeptide repeat protein [Pirellulaceae bacterium]|nr:tetratricopeptide repeat protein [Pirellulaceae bacterium]HMO91244.1 tetratricopeptide repeat protein [Pirellulaceae bacterium]HMP68572.1 tetratricopeptide repeat protein [Pirellulaceae bacterium]